MTHPTWGDKPPRVAGSLPPMRPDQELQVAVTRAGSGPAPQSPVVVARLVLVGGGTVSGVFVYDPTIGFGNLIGWMTDSALDPFGNVDHPVVGAGNPATTAATFMTKNANIHFTVVHFTADGLIGAGEENTGTVPFPWPGLTIDAPEQAGSTGHIRLALFGGNKETTKGPTAFLGLGTSQNYPNQACWYAPSTSAVDDGAALTAIFALGVQFIYLLPGTYHGVTTVIANENQYIIPLGGFQAVTWNLVTTGIAAFQWKQAAAGTYVTTASGGILDPGLTIVGPSGTANPSDGTIGVQMADIPHLKCTAQVIRCQTPFLSSNQNFFTEQADFKIYTKDCTNGPIFQVAASGGAGRSGSFDRTKVYWSADETLNASYGQGLQLLAGASFEGGRIEQVGNWKGTGKAGVFALVVSGNFGASNSDIVSCDLVHALEYDGSGTAIGTISVAAPNSITPATGRLDYGANFGPSSILGNWSFSGPVNGDDTLLTNLWTVQNSGFLAGWTGTVKFRWAGNQKGLFGAQAGDMAALDIALTIAAGTTITSGTTVFTLPAGYFFATNNKRIIVTLAQFGLSPIAAFLTIGTAGAVTWSGATVTVPGGGTSSVFGDAVYPVLV